MDPTERSRSVMSTYLYEVAAKGRLDLIDELFHPDVIDEAAMAFGGPAGRDGLVAHVVGFRRHVHALELRVHNIVAGTDEVMAQWSFTGVHRGPWLGREPTNGPVTGTVFSFFELSDGKVSRYWLWLHAMLDEPVVFDSSNPVSAP